MDVHQILGWHGEYDLIFSYSKTTARGVSFGRRQTFWFSVLILICVTTYNFFGNPALFLHSMSASTKVQRKPFRKRIHKWDKRFALHIFKCSPRSWETCSQCVISLFQSQIFGVMKFICVINRSFFLTSVVFRNCGLNS